MLWNSQSSIVCIKNMTCKIPIPQFAQFLSLTIALATVSLTPLAAIEVTTESLRTTESKIQNLVSKNLPATVALIPGDPKRQYGTGSGVIVSEDGLILTAAHVTMGMNDWVTVLFPDGTRAKGKVLGMDFTRDSGMVQIVDKGKFPHVEIGQSTDLEENEWCIALGHAGGYQPNRPPPVRLGRVIQNDQKGFLRTDSALISGDSGGPLFDIDGKLIGIHSNIGSSLSQNNHVPISTYLTNWNRLKNNERFGGDEDNSLLLNPDRPVIGASLGDIKGRSGALIEKVVRRSPAAKAGLRTGDLIIKANEVPVKDSDALIEAIRKHRPGESIKLTVASGKVEKKVAVRLVAAKTLNGSSAGTGPRNQKQRLPKRTPQETKELQEEFDQILRESIAEGKLKLTENLYQKFHSPADFTQFMERFKKTLSESEMKTLYRISAEPKPIPVVPATFDPDAEFEVGEEFFRNVLTSFHPSNSRASDATHLVFRGNDWKSLCTVISEDGYALTKFSEIDTKNNQKLGVLIAKGKLVPAKVVKTFADFDLALIKLESQSRLAAIDLSGQSLGLPPGTMISAPGTGRDPIAIGLVSVSPRSLSGENKGFLGIGTAYHKNGVEVTMVLDDAAASIAGIKEGDIITKIDNQVCDTPEKLIRQISRKRPGTNVIIQLLRNGRGTTFKVTLGDRKVLDEDAPDPSGRMNKMGTKVSEVSGGFPKVTQTDLPLTPQQCGGPVVDLDGNVIGINIARAGRIKSFMIPIEEVRKLVAPILSKVAKVTN